MDAYLNQGRWVAECPDCHSAVKVKDLGAAAVYRTFGCVECGYGVPKGAWKRFDRMPVAVRIEYHLDEIVRGGTVPVRFPEDVETIETELAKRGRAIHRNWKPGETVADLKRENAKHRVE